MTRITFYKKLLNIKTNIISITLFLLLIFCPLTNTNNCSITNSLTQSQNLQLKQFTSASYLPLSQHPSLTSAYSSLPYIDKYQIQLSDQFNFTINDIPTCTNIPQYVTFTSMDDVWLCFLSTFMVLECNKQWELKIGCGTLIEIHKPFNTQILGKIMLDKNSVPGPTSISPVGLCAGTYHLWFIYSTRIGKVIKSVKPIFISYPPCECQ